MSGEAVIVKPDEEDIRRAKRFLEEGGDFLTRFSRSLTADATVNVTVVQALRQIKALCDHHGEIPKLVGQLKEVAQVMLGSPEAGKDDESLFAFFDLSPDGIAGKASASIDEVVQGKCKQDDLESFDLYSETYYQMQICVKRHKGLVSMYYASVTATQFSLANLIRDDAQRKTRLAALKVQTQAYLADRLSARAPTLAVQNDKPLGTLPG